MQHDTIAVIDFGGQYAHLIANKVRRQKVRAEIRQPEDPIELFEAYRGIILSGSPSLSSQGEDSHYTKQIFDLDVPILGFCFGHQEIAKHYGGAVIHGAQEWGKTELKLVGGHALFEDVPDGTQVWMSHFDSVSAVGPGFREIAYSVLGDGHVDHRFAAIANDELRRFGFQYHPEVDDSEHGEEMIANFVLGICGCEPSWTMDRYLEEQMLKIRTEVGEQSVFLLASGGVDSTVAAKLFSQALPEGRLELLHVDNGMMRKDESRKVLQIFERVGLGDNLHFVDASEHFVRALSGEVEPEAKRKIIGTTFVEVFDQEARSRGFEDHLLGQGTIYPDTIETGGTKRADTIKTHHNRVPLIEQLMAEGKVVEPLAELYKEEVRELGRRLGIPSEALDRHPFPGPGLGVRLLCATGENGTHEVAALQEELDARLRDQALDGLALPIRSVGVKADLRSYEHPVMLGGEMSWARLLEIGSAVLKEIAGLNRCVLNLAPEMPRSARPVAATVSRQRLDLLRDADEIVMDGLRRHGLYEEIWQCPTVLVPLVIDDRGEELIVVRPVHSRRAMTAAPAQLPEVLLTELRRDLLALPRVSGLALDITSKPPGTIEWE